ncbi:MAG: pyrimidine 5'-nucleotidase [Anaerolineaceae bacterium]|jgi:pyrimidine 5'-nucleotidase|nr:pyrimidine 5'-nucleotidase [Anaerolineaceae bacterium]MDD4042808.1 pyrimidine 5'-nucleotidase [Anaerolineaceae bacterium]MDD4577498.1 pyrimidine 5'-nucleotidase [Anaerolineaceae bacterium]
MSRLQLLLIDLDDTVYPPDTGAWDILGDRIDEFMAVNVGIPRLEIRNERERLFNLHGTTMKGLQLEYGADVNDYLAYVHDVNLSEVIKEDPALRQALLKIPQEKWIFTNASRPHAEQVLRLVGIRDLFTEIIDVLTTEPYCKPDPRAFKLVLEKAGNPDPACCLFIDDRTPNLDTARDLGLRTVLVDPFGNSSDNHFAIRKLSDLPGALLQGGFLD